jgi:hypothetical protein
MGHPETSLLERMGTARLKQRHLRLQQSSTVPDSDGVVHLLDARERAALDRLERQTLWRAAAIGAGSASIVASVEVLLLPHAADTVVYWSILGSVSAGCAVVELVLLSLDALHGAHGLAFIAGAVVDDDTREQTFRSLARAALELPNPVDADVSVDPLKETPRVWLLVAGLVYKLKVSATNIVLKMLLRRAMGRATLRALVVPFVSVPVAAVWNVFVCRQVLRESRVRVLGPGAADDVVNRVLPADKTISDAQAEAALRAVGACVVRSADLHPNLVALLRALRRRLGSDAVPRDLDDSRRFLHCLATLPAEEQGVVRTILRAAAVLDGKVRGKERQLLREAGAEDGVDDVLVAFIAGLPLPLGASAAVSGGSP